MAQQVAVAQYCPYGTVKAIYGTRGGLASDGKLTMMEAIDELG